MDNELIDELIESKFVKMCNIRDAIYSLGQQASSVSEDSDIYNAYQKMIAKRQREYDKIHLIHEALVKYKELNKE